MRARAYNKRFELWETTNEPDGFGGFLTSVNLLSASWCKIATANVGGRYNNSNSTDYGILDPTETLVITTRKRNDITYNSETQYIVYRGVKYIISTTPSNVDFEDNTIQFTVVKSSSKEGNTKPIGGTFTYTFPFNLA